MGMKRIPDCRFIAEAPAGYVAKCSNGMVVAASPDGPALILKDGKWEELKLVKEVVDAEAVDA